MVARLSYRLAQRRSGWLRPAALGLAALLLAGCTGQPVRLDAIGKVNAELAPSPHLSPVQPQPLPRHGYGPSNCCVAVVDVDGLLLNADATGLGSWGENPVSLFRERLDTIEHDPRIRAVVVRINSPGGSVTASDIMWRDLLAFKRRTSLPVVACLMDVAAGGGYYLATACDQIVAHPTTVTGAIGCILNVYNLQDLMAQFNIIGAPIKAGKNIDLGSPIKALDEEHRELLQTMADEFHRRFRQIVLKQRPEVDGGDETTFDGRVFTARQARELHLIDSVGYFDNAVQTARSLAQVDQAEVVFLHRHGDAALSPYATTPNVPLQKTVIPINVPGLDRSRLPSFLYLWQIEPSTETLLGK
jgi:protease-4